MQVFDAIGFGASSVVRKAIHVPTHRIVALKRINVFEKVLIGFSLPSLPFSSLFSHHFSLKLFHLVFPI